MWSDRESESDYLNFGEVSLLAADTLTSPGMLPVSIGIFGNWGAGKSTVLKLIENELRKKSDEYLIVTFDAWLYQGYDDARAALLEVIARELGKAADGNTPLVNKAKDLLARVNVFRVLGLLAEGVALAHGVPTGGFLARGIGSLDKLTDMLKGEGELSKEDYEALKKTAEDAKKEAGALIKKAEQDTPPQQIDAFRKEYGEILSELGKPLIVIIDNLDRCLPSNAIHTLEAIRLFLFLPNTAFVIAADEEMIRGAVAEYFKGASDRHQIDYLDKLIQVPIRVPKAGVREIRSYLFMLFAEQYGVTAGALETLRKGLEEALQQSWQADPITKEKVLELTGKDDEELIRAFELADRIAPILATSPIIQGNPRIVKRLLNVVSMRASIAKRRSMPLDESVITKLVIFERCAGAEATADLYRLIDATRSGKPKIFESLEDSELTRLPEDAPKSWKDNPTTSDFILEWSKLDPPLKDVDLRAAIYLSRETMPIGVYVVGLSPKGREALQTLVRVASKSSPIGNKVVEGLPLEDQVPVMEGIIDHLRQVGDWSRQPDGFAGACLLAQRSPEAAAVFKRYINNMGKQPIWMATMLKTQGWYKD